jgi:4-amino-4-deoxy-L-arabinose transferase-like glycosyltransferase
MTAAVAGYVRRVGGRQVVRPWALCTPVVVLLICLPLLRPLRAPLGPTQGELTVLATVQALVEADSLAVQDTEAFAGLRELDRAREERAERDRAAAEKRAARVPVPAWASGEVVSGTIVVSGRYYGDQPPVLAWLLSWPYALMHRMGWDVRHNPAGVAYALTLLGVTLPAAVAAGLVYRLGRMFELKRPWRAGLALAVALGSGLLSYATVLNPHAPAAALVMVACACLYHVTVAKGAGAGGASLVAAGLAASLAAVVDFSAAFFLVGLVFVVAALRWDWRLRVGGVLLYGIGALPPVLLHLSLTLPVTGDWRPGFLHGELAGIPRPQPQGPTAADELDEAPARPPAWKVAVFRAVDRTLGALVGSKGLLTHYPVVIVGVLGLGLVLRRHWPGSTKMMAAATGAAAVGVVAISVAMRVDWSGAMFGPRWYVVFLPLLLFWGGAWLRKPHRAATWAGAAALLAVSAAVSLVGAAAPGVRADVGEHSAVAGVRSIMTGGQAAVERDGGVEVAVGR